jgi:outer membrane protein W
MRLTKIAAAGLVTLLILGFASPVCAEKGDMLVRFGVLYSTPTDDLVDGDQTTELDAAFGFQASFEYLITDLMGIEPAITTGKHDVTVKESGFPDLDIGEIGLFTLTANLNFHLLRESKIDLLLGPTIGFATWGDLKTTEFPEDFPVDDEFIYGVNVGLDVPFGEGKWGFSGALNYLLAGATLEGSSEEIGVNPLQVKVGISYKF